LVIYREHVVQVSATHWPEPSTLNLQQLRIDLAAAFRLAVEFDWHEAVGNHFSAAVSSDGRQFLMNPRNRHFATLCASDLQLLDADDEQTMSRANAPDASAWCIHGTIHRRQPTARVVMHCHPPYATALACLKNPELVPIDQNTAGFYGRVAIDRGYGGIADDAVEGERLAQTLGKQPVMLMGNHGVSVAGATVAETFNTLFFFERACRTLMLAYSSGQALNVLSEEVAKKTAQDWTDYSDSAFAHFEQLKLLLDKRDSSYRD
jgi:ribulose-5-phosphate 4-epimerase/fuculose-1-phosphate aldolase